MKISFLVSAIDLMLARSLMYLRNTKSQQIVNWGLNLIILTCLTPGPGDKDISSARLNTNGHGSYTGSGPETKKHNRTPQNQLY